MASNEVQLVAVGDIQPNRARPETLFELVAPTFKQADIRYAQLECTISDKGTLRTDVRNPAHRVPPRNIDALTSAGFDIISYAGNNQLDYGEEAFLDTMERLEGEGIKVVGAGRTLNEAQSPVIHCAKDTRIAFVNFCSILRDGFQATSNRSGISPLTVKTFYEPLENIYEQPGTPARTITIPDHDELQVALESIKSAKQNADIVVASFHWGVHFTHDLAMYQPEVAYAAIDAGADLVLGTHPHCLQSIDVYKGKAIFYSLGNFAFEQPEKIAQKGVGEYLSFYGIPLEKELPQHPHPSHCRKTMIVKCTIQDKQIVRISVLPVYFNDNAQPEILTPTSTMYEDVMGLIERLSSEVGVHLTREDGEGVVPQEKACDIDTRDLIRKRKISYPSLSKLATEVV
jgi:poly-gamma-glutamate capsule biosynthesis protein CapA/YwtB (metallophosphatase superfamily)